MFRDISGKWNSIKEFMETKYDCESLDLISKSGSTSDSGREVNNQYGLNMITIDGQTENISEILTELDQIIYGAEFRSLESTRRIIQK